MIDRPHSTTRTRAAQAGLPRESTRAEGRTADRQLPGHEPAHFRAGGGHGAPAAARRQDGCPAQHLRPQVGRPVYMYIYTRMAYSMYPDLRAIYMPYIYLHYDDPEDKRS